jgi:putative ABC transport system permease protein
MNTVSRGIRNAFRNAIRTFSIIIILGLVIGLSFVMLIANHAVNNKIESVRRSVGNTVTIRPAGSDGTGQVSNGLSATELDKVKDLAHITQVVETLDDRLQTEGSASAPDGARMAEESGGYTTSLKSPTTLNADGPVFTGKTKLPDNFSFPIAVWGTTDPLGTIDTIGSTVTLKQGEAIDGTKDVDEVLVSTAMADKNGLEVGSTFTAYDATLKVAGIFESNTKAADNYIIISLPALQRLSGNPDAVKRAVATVDSVTNTSAVTAAIQKTLGDTVDVTSSEDTVKNAIKPLQSIQTISLYSLIGAVIAAGVIILLVMIMIVRERRREIGVIKAIGSSNLRVMLQFMVEALTLTILGAVVGLMIGIAAGTPVTKTLVDNSANSSENATRMGGGPGGPPSSAIQDIRDVQAQVGWTIVLSGLGAAIGIALVGSAAASFFIAKVKPAEVLRSE